VIQRIWSLQYHAPRSLIPRGSTEGTGASEVEEVDAGEGTPEDCQE